MSRRLLTGWRGASTPSLRDALSTLPHSPQRAPQSAHTGEARWRDLLQEPLGPSRSGPQATAGRPIELDRAPGVSLKVLILGTPLAAG